MINVGLIGSRGHVQSMLDHIERVDDVTVPCISDMDGHAGDWATRVEKSVGSSPRVYDGWARMCQRESLDGVIVCTDSTAKPQVVAECLGMGIHVLAEKPLSLSHEGVDFVADARNESAATLSLMLSQRFRPDYTYMKERVQGGEIGEVVSVFAANPHVLRNRKIPLQGGVVLDLAIHIIDLVFWITGQRPTSIMGARANKRGFGDDEDSAQLLLVLEDGATALLDSTEHYPEQIGSSPPTSTGLFPLVVTGTEGVLESGRLERFKGAVNWFRHRQEPRGRLFEITTYREVMRSFIKNIETGMEDPILPAKDVIEVSHIALYAAEAAAAQSVVNIEWT